MHDFGIKAKLNYKSLAYYTINLNQYMIESLRFSEFSINLRDSLIQI